MREMTTEAQRTRRNTENLIVFTGVPLKFKNISTFSLCFISVFSVVKSFKTLCLFHRILCFSVVTELSTTLQLNRLIHKIGSHLHLFNYFISNIQGFISIIDAYQWRCIVFDGIGKSFQFHFDGIGR
jgi:hypothetical protein